MSKQEERRPLTAISLFSGAGGMDLGFQLAGFKILVSVEADPSCCETLRANLPETLILHADVNKVSGDELLRLAELERGDLDLIIGGPPCQSFSLAGNRKGLDDPRGHLVREFVRIVRETLPKAVVMENVQGLDSWAGGQARHLIIQELTNPVAFGDDEYSYACKSSVLNAAGFGVPQVRQRLFIVGNRIGREFRFPAPTHDELGSDLFGEKKPWVTVGDAIGPLPPPAMPSATAQRVSETIKGRIAKHGY